MNRRFSFGFTLVELMVSLVLGLVVTGGVLGVFLSNKQVYRQNENLARMQESARYAFELMARDIREAGGIACGSNLPTANVLNDFSTRWWSNWGDGIRGFEGSDDAFPKAFGTAAADRVGGTDAVVVHSGTVNDGVYITGHIVDPDNPDVFNFNAHSFEEGDILLVCDYGKATIFQNTAAPDTTTAVVYDADSSSPGNCHEFLNPCGNDSSRVFDSGGFISKLSANAWYIGYNGRGGRSLYRLKLQNNSGTPGTTAEEIAEGVTDLQIQYLTRDPSGVLAPQYVDATAIPDYDGDGAPDWQNVVAARLTFTFQTLEQVGTNTQAVERRWYTVVNLRNRMS